MWKYYPFYNMSIKEVPLCTAQGLCLPLNIPVELFLYALPKDCVRLWIFHVSSPVELFLYALPKDCTAQGLCLPLNIPCFQSGGTIFWSKTYKKLKKKINCVKIKNLKLELTWFFPFQRICWKYCHVLLHMFILVVWFVIDGLFFSFIFWKSQIDPFYC